MYLLEICILGGFIKEHQKFFPTSGHNVNQGDLLLKLVELKKFSGNLASKIK